MKPLPDVLETLATRIDGLPDAVALEFRRVAQDGAALLLDINREYIEAGDTADAQRIQAGGYSAAYAKYKAKYGTYTNTAYVDLKLTGAFLKSLELQWLGGLEFLIIATDDKFAFLDKYGKLLGIRAADLDAFVREVLKPEVEAYITRYLTT